MFGFGDAQEKHQEIYGDAPVHESKFSHELIAGGAGYEAMKAWEKHEEAKGGPVSHARAKEVLAGLAAAEVDKLFETKGLDFLDREKAKHEAKKNAEHLYEEKYGGGDNFQNGDKFNY